MNRARPSSPIPRVGAGWKEVLIALAVAALSSVRAEIPVYEVGETGFNLTRLHAIGPLKASYPRPVAKPFFEDEPERMPEHEAELIALTWHAGYPTHALSSSDGAYDFPAKFRVDEAATEVNVVYLVATLRAAKAQDAWLLLGSDDQVAVFVNGEKLFQFEQGRAAQPCQNGVRLPLRAGDNLLVAKVANLNRGWGFVGRIEGDLGGAIAHVATVRGPLLDKAILTPGEPVRLLSEAFDLKLSAAAEVVNDGTGEATPIQFVNGTATCPAGLAPGTYTLRLPLGARTLTHGFGIGSWDEIRHAAERTAVDLPQDERLARGLSAYHRRLEIIATAVERNKDLGNWDRGIMSGDLGVKAVYAAQHYARIVRQARSGVDPFRDAPGLTIRGFKSRIDDQVLYYRLFVPSAYARGAKRLPLIVVLHPIFSVQRPFIDGVAIASHDEAMGWSQNAEKLGMGIVWVGYRVCPYGNPIEFTHMDEVLDHVALDYEVDEERLTLLGNCSAAIPASLAVVREPNRFAGILMVNPVLMRYRNRYDDDGRYLSFPAYKQWLLSRNPVNLAPQLDVPIRIIHESSDPEHGAIEHSLAFMAAMTAAGKAPKFDRPKTPSGQWISRTLFSGFEWLSRQRRPSGRPARARADEAGPISTLLAERFVVVGGTAGDANAQRANARVLDEFKAAWRKTNFGPCRALLDTELTPPEEASAHLVLIGSPETNRVWARLKDVLEIQLGPDEVTIAGRKLPVPNGAIQAWCRHPHYPGRKILLLGAHHPQDLRFGTLELALDGWFDYSIWRRVGDKGLLMKAEAYDDPLALRVPARPEMAAVARGGASDP